MSSTIFTVDSSNGYISEPDFFRILDGYNRECQDKRRSPLINRETYQNIVSVLSGNATAGDAKFRSWAKANFVVKAIRNLAVLYATEKRTAKRDAKTNEVPVACTDQIYDILVQSHAACSHGGRDRTSAIVRQHYACVPKELIVRFVKNCPTCAQKKHRCFASPPAAAVDSSSPASASISGYAAASASSYLQPSPAVLYTAIGSSDCASAQAELGVDFAQAALATDLAQAGLEVDIDGVKVDLSTIDLSAIDLSAFGLSPSYLASIGVQPVDPASPESGFAVEANYTLQPSTPAYQPTEYTGLADVEFDCAAFIDFTNGWLGLGADIPVPSAEGDGFFW